MLYNANGSFLYYRDDNYGMTNDYYQCIVKLIQTILQNNPELNINVILCDNYNFNNSNHTLTININYEHTLVKCGGRDVPDGTPHGNIADDTNETYLVRIYNYNVLNNSDIIIDYSNPNICNVKTCSKYSSFSKKHIYISPSIYNPYFIKENRNIITLTTFTNANEKRRAELLKNIENEKLEHTNINNCFEINQMQCILKATKILINIHQTPHHHTFEELRALPALECGVIVISEKSPLIELIPYSDLIIWSSYEDIIEKTKEVINNYDFFHNKIFSIENMARLHNFKKINYNVLQNAILEKNTFNCEP
jgi:hypothetical protein